ncbi:DMT family transporter [Aminipila luticellarii]|uniref:DMT family transporter n=1 Tax=Aminipila luticellarii TaxID=2507160 RepID=A0A410PUJ6_9FIRM|nr:DMT family transporter [Aminipila luticellarii]QAT42593.1 DMT family transporter [Aminipila luticellarii]
MKENNKEILSVSGLVVCALLWGFGFPALKAVETLPTFYIISIRFAVAAVVLGILFYKQLKFISRELIKNAFILSLLNFSLYIFTTVGIKYTTSAKASFFSCLGFLIIPILNLILYKQKFTRTTAISVFICLAGIVLLSYSPGMGFGLALGDIICMGSSLTGSFSIIYLDRISQKGENTNPVLLSILMMCFTAVWGFCTALVLGDFTASPTKMDWGILLFIGLFCTCAAFLLQTVCQKYVPSNRVGVIFAIEPTSGAFLSVLLLHERMGLVAILGGILVICSLLYQEILSSKAAASD